MARKKNSGKKGGVGRVVTMALGFSGLALVATSLAILMIHRTVLVYQAELHEVQQPADTVLVIAAARPLYQGIVIVDEDLYAIAVPRAEVPPGVYLSPDQVIGRVPRERILENEWIRSERLAAADAGLGLSALIPRGMYGVSVNIQNGAALSGFLEPGSYVDVLVTMDSDERRPPGAPEEPVTRTVMQAVLVLAVNSRLEDTTEPTSQRQPKPSVTMLVTAEQALQLSNAVALGRVTLTLRNDQDVDIATLGGARIEDLRRKLVVLADRARPQPIARAAPKKLCSQFAMISGGEKEVVMIDANGAPCE